MAFISYAKKCLLCILSPFWKDEKSNLKKNVYPSKRVRMDGVFLRLAGLLHEISPWLCLQDIPQSSPASPQKTPSIPSLLLGFTQSLFALIAVSTLFEILPIHLLLLPIGIFSTKSSNVSPKQSPGVIKLCSCRALKP